MTRHQHSYRWWTALTAEEKRTIAIICCLVVLGLLAKHYREDHAPSTVTPEATSSPSRPQHR